MTPPFKHFIIIDWLQITFQTASDLLLYFNDSSFQENEALELDGNWMMIFKGIGDKFYRYRGDLYCDGELYGTILFQPRSKILAPNLVNVKIDNRLLYSNYWKNLTSSLERTLALSFNNITRLDIAVDTPQRVCNVMEIVNRYASGDRDIERTGRQELKLERFNDESRRFEGFSIGKMGDPKRTKGYDKTKEIDNSSHKEYIKEAWEKTGFGKTAKMFRVEITLKSKQINKIKDFNMWKLDDPSYLASIFKQQAKNTFDFRYRESEKQNVSRMTKVELIDYESLGATKLETVKKISKKSSRTVKIITKFIYELHRKNSLKGANNVVEYLVEEFGLKRWFEDKVSYWNYVNDNQLAAETAGISGSYTEDFSNLIQNIKEKPKEDITDDFGDLTDSDVEQIEKSFDMAEIMREAGKQAVAELEIL